MRKHRNFFQLTEQEKPPEKTTNETKIYNLPDKEFKALVIRMLTELGKRIDGHRENFNKEQELKNIITVMKNILEGINNRLGDTE